MFPNQHDVYMHDTPTEAPVQDIASAPFSHGCIRVRNPRKLAELVFNLDRGWDRDRVEDQFDSGDNAKVDLNREIPVHNVYFTAVVGEDGKVRRFSDVYDHDQRIARALAGVPAEVIARDDPARRHEASVNEGLSNLGRQGRRSREAWNREPVSMLDWRPSGGSRSRARSGSRPRTMRRGGTTYYYWGTN